MVQVCVAESQRQRPKESESGSLPASQRGSNEQAAAEGREKGLVEQEHQALCEGTGWKRRAGRGARCWLCMLRQRQNLKHAQTRVVAPAA